MMTTTVTDNLDVPKEIQDVITAGSVGGIVLAQCDEILFGLDSPGDKEIAKDAIGRVLEIVQDQFYLVPKVEFGDNDQVIDRPEPEGALKEHLAHFWDSVSE